MGKIEMEIKISMCVISETYKVKEAASYFVMRVGVWLQQLFHHCQEISVHTANLFQVGEQHLVETHMEVLKYIARI